MTVTTSPYAPPPLPPPYAPPPRPPTPPAPLGVLGRALAAGSLAAVLVPGNRWGAGTVVALLGLAVAAPPGARLRTPTGAALATGATALVVVAGFRDAGWLVATCLVAAFAAWSLLLSGRTGWATTVSGLAAVTVRSLPSAAGLARGLPQLLAADRRSALAPLARAALVTALLLAVFGGLFATADAAFGELLGRLALPAPGPLLVGRLLLLALVAVLVGAAVQVAAAPPVTGVLPPYAGRRLGPVEWVLPLVVLDLLFAAFVAVQVTVLFGGRDHVLSTSGLTYAQYARQGFGQLVLTAVLTLAVVAVTVRVVPRTPGARRVQQLLLGVLCLLTLVVLASASRRLALYEQEYGFTRLRLSVDGAIGWLAVVIVLVLVAGLLERSAWLPRAVVLSAVAGLLAFAVADPEARIAERNMERFTATGQLDAWYLSTLSADAVPALQELPEPERSCVLRDVGARGRQRLDGRQPVPRAGPGPPGRPAARPPGSCPWSQDDPVWSR